MREQITANIDLGKYTTIKTLWPIHQKHKRAIPNTNKPA
jgi:hypothetical protein